MLHIIGLYFIVFTVSYGLLLHYYGMKAGVAFVFGTIITNGLHLLVNKSLLNESKRALKEQRKL